VLGLPLWVLVSLTAVFCLALWTVRVLATTWVERSEGDDGGDRGTTS